MDTDPTKDDAVDDNPNRHLLSLIERRLHELELSERQACLRAGLQLDSIRGLRRGYKPNLRKLRQLAPVLDLKAEYLLAAAALDDQHTARASLPDMGGDGEASEAARTFAMLATPAGEPPRQDLTIVADRTPPFDSVMIGPGYVPDLSFKVAGVVWVVEVKRMGGQLTAFIWPMMETPHVRRAEVEITHMTPGAAATYIARALAVGAAEPTPAGHRSPSSVADLPIYAARETGRGISIDFGRPVRWTTRPEPLITVPDAFALYVLVDDMAPRFEIGDVVFVNPIRPARPGDFVLVVEKDGGTDFARMRRLVSRGEDGAYLERLNPPDHERLIPSDTARLHPIVGSIQGT